MMGEGEVPGMDEEMMEDPMMDNPSEEVLEPELPSDVAAAMEEELNEQIGSALQSIVDTFTREDDPIRQFMSLVWVRNDYYWRGIFNIYWSEIASAWREFPSDYELFPGQDDQNVNIYRGYGQSIIAALSASLPNIKFFPSDADSPDDLETAKAYTIASEAVQKHNSAEILLVRILFYMYKQGTVFVYSYPEGKEEYGIVETPVYSTKTMYQHDLTCPACGNVLETYDDENPETDPIETPGPCPNPTCPSVTGMQNPDGTFTPPSPIIPVVDTKEYSAPFIKEYQQNVKKRVCIEVYGCLNVRVNPYVKSQKDIQYLILSDEKHYSYLREQYPDHEAKISGNAGGDIYRSYRLGPDLNYYTSEALCTRERAWLRPSAYRIFTEDKEEYELLKQTFPNGCKATFINKEFIEAEAADLDQCWTISDSPVDNFVYSDAIGADLVPIQEMRADLDRLKIETIRYGIPENFADPAVLDFKVYAKRENKVGQVVPAIPRQGQSLKDAFHETRSATLSQEVPALTSQLDTDAQFVTGAYPSIYGGQQEGGSNTLGEYRDSAARSLQRLGLYWRIVNNLWAKVIHKATAEYLDNLLEDEKIVKAQGTGFVNVWVKRTALFGKVGTVEPEASEQFPVSWQQKNGILMTLLNMKNQSIDAALFHPENTSLIARILGLSELYIPGDEDRNKTLINIMELAKAAPLPGMPTIDPVTGAQIPGPEMPSIQIEPAVDNIPVAIETIKAFLNSMVGIELKRTLPLGYRNVVAYLTQYTTLQQQQMMQEQMAAAAAGGDNGQSGDVGPVS